MSEEPRSLPELSREELGELESIFDDVVHVPPPARAAILADRCAGRPQLRAEVEALLDSHDRLGDFLKAPDRAVIAAVENDDAVSASDRMGVGSTVGPYRLVEHIGEGGMGNVYLAERADGLFRHRVAIKVTHSSARSGDAARRFRAERQILASLQHPNIVTLLDGGVTPAGEAYLVMEHVAGVPITAHCQTHGLPLEARLQLVRQVAGAVQFAHQHGIVHRDLKPGNILVTEDGTVKVLDFGVAKLLEAPAGGDRTITRTFPGPLTPNYASPEQLRDCRPRRRATSMRSASSPTRSSPARAHTRRQARRSTMCSKWCSRPSRRGLARSARTMTAGRGLRILTRDSKAISTPSSSRR